jgi:hypothetical protein
MSTSYVYYREVTLEDGVLDITKVDNECAGVNDKLIINDNKFKKPMASTQSELNLNKEKTDIKGIWKSRSLTSLNYDGDTDSINGENDEINYEEIKLKCSICDIEYNAYLEFPAANKDVQDGIGKKIKRHRRRKADDTSQPKVNFEEYKDWAHRMEEFDPKAERKWTLEYQQQVDEELPHLSKIIIGRGHENEFPELNNIHLFDNVKLYRKSPWRNAIFDSLKKCHDHIKLSFSLIPSNQTCLFCFTERQNEIMHSLSEGKMFISHKTEPIKKKNSFSKETDKSGMIFNGFDSTQSKPKVSKAKSLEKMKLTIDKQKLKNVFTGKAITRIIRSRKQSFEKSLDVDNEAFDDVDNEEFEVL